MTDGPAGLVLPGTPLLLPGVDPREPGRMARLRARVVALLRESPVWVLPVPGPAVPPALSLGGLGVAIGAPVQGTGPCGRVEPDALRDGPGLAQLIDGLDDAEAARAAQTGHGTVVSALLAAQAGAHVHLHAAAADCAAGDDAPLLLPVDFSAAAHPDAPLAPRSGADDFDDLLLRALRGPVDTAALAELADEAHGFAADPGPLALADLAGVTGTLEAQEDLHHVRYAVVSLRTDAG